MKKFEVNKKYTGRFIGNQDCVFDMEVISRTEKTIKAVVDGVVKTLRPAIYDDMEIVKPYGNYSMCPIVRAE